MTRAAMWALLAVVAGSAAVLSFAALRDLAILCGFSPSLAWLLPVVIDAGAAAGCLVWLSRSSEEEDLLARRFRNLTGCPSSVAEEDLLARRFARSLTLVLLSGSVAGNAVVHGLSAYRLEAPWWLVVAVSAVAPAVLGAVVHLAVLVAQGPTSRRQIDADGLGDRAEGGRTRESDPVTALIESGAGRRRLARELSISEHEARRLLAERTNGARS